MSLTNQSSDELDQVKNFKQTNNNVDIDNVKTSCNINSDNENVTNTNANFSTRISIKSIQDDNQSVISSEIFDSLNGDELILQPHSSESLNQGIISSDGINLCGIRNNNCQAEGLKVNSLAIQNSNDVTIGNKTFYTGPITINQFLPNETCDNHGKFQNDIENITEENGKQKKVSNGCDAFYKTSSDRNVISKKCLIISISSFLFLMIFIISGIIGVLLTTTTDEEISAESWNIRIINRTEWGAKPAKEELEPFVTTPYISLIGHTVTEECSTQSSCKLRVKFIQNLMLDNGYSDIGYNFLVGGDGMVYEGCGWNKIGMHTKGYNNHSIGIAFIGNFMLVKPPVKQLKAAQWILDECINNGKLTKDYKLYGVRQVYPSQSPGDELYKIIKDWPHWTDEIVE